MTKWLAALFILFPAAEIWVIIEIGHSIGGWETFGLLLLTGFAGAWLARSEGRKVWSDVQRQLQEGRMPGFALLDGLCVLIGGILLMLPGFLTDIVGITLLLPITRPFYRLLLFRWLEKKMKSGSFSIRGGPFRG